jgi:hypothetical protein
MLYGSHMGGQGRVELRPIHRDDLDSVANFLHRHLNSRVSPDAWAASLVPPWQADSPNHGFMLLAQGQVVGVHLAFYSNRLFDNEPLRLCNLAAWCVREEFRSDGIRLLRALLAQKNLHFTDLSPSGNVVEINKRLKFRQLDTATELMVNVGWPSRSGIRVSADPELIRETLAGRDLEIYSDHVGAAAAHHLVAVDGAEYCYVITRKDRRKNLPLFASILYVGNPGVFRTCSRQIFAHLLRHQGAVFTLAEIRIVGYRPPFSVLLKKSRPKMFKSDRLRPEQIDNLYSELTCVPW